MYYSSPEQAVTYIQPGDKVFIHSAASSPRFLIEAMASQADRLERVSIYSIHTEGDLPYAHPDLISHFDINCFFVGANTRSLVQSGQAQYIPVFLQEIPALFRTRRIDLDVAMLSVSKPNEKGFCSLGVSVDVSLAAFQTARYKIAEVNDKIPFTAGDGIIHIDDFDALVEVSQDLYEYKKKKIGKTEAQIGKHVASLIEDRSCLQMGIGSIPEATLNYLKGHKNIGIHTELCTDSVAELLESGVITGAYKKTNPGKIVTGFALGDETFYRYLHKNHEFLFKDSSYVNDTRTIRQNPRTVAINSAIEVDITGQVCADSIGSLQYSGVGGQMDFIRGAGLSEGGKAIIALPSRTHSGIPRIVPVLKPGASVVTTRAHVQYVITEYGIADLYGKSLNERAKAMINIAHPEDREAMCRLII